MSRYPTAEWRPLPESERQPLMVARQLILHSIVGSAAAAFNLFRGESKLESHFIVPKQGAPWQLVDTGRTADANGEANVRAISAETEDNGNPDTDPWNDNQLNQLVALALWAEAEHGIPLRRIPSPKEPGIGYHTMFGAPGPWTRVRGKTCPGVVRIAQFNEVLLPRIIQARTPSLPSLPPLSFPTERRPAQGDLPVLTVFHKGPHVEMLQHALNVKAGQGLAVSGVFDGATFTAVQNYQRYFGLAGTGTVGPTTWSLLLGLPL